MTNENEFSMKLYLEKLKKEQSGSKPPELNSMETWIPVEERLPKSNDILLVCAKNGTWEENRRMAYFSASGYFYVVDNMGHPEECVRYQKDITNWMELTVEPENKNSKTMDDLREKEMPIYDDDLNFEDNHWDA